MVSHLFTAFFLFPSVPFFNKRSRRYSSEQTTHIIYGVNLTRSILAFFGIFFPMKMEMKKMPKSIFLMQPTRFLVRGRNTDMQSEVFFFE